jgi:hypothetical protein
MLLAPRPLALLPLGVPRGRVPQMKPWIQARRRIDFVNALDTGPTTR